MNSPSFNLHHDYSNSHFVKCRWPLFKSWIPKKLRKRGKISCSLLYVLHNTWKLSIFTSWSCIDSNEMYNKAWCTCRVVVLLYWPTAFWRSSRVAVSILPSSLRPLNPKQNNKVCSALESGYSMMKTGVFLWIPSKMPKPNCPPTEVFRVRDAGIFDKLCLVPYCTYCRLWNIDLEPCIMFHESNLNWNWCIW